MNELKFNSQICTTREQSQRLLELGLKPETADKVYHNTNSRTEIMRWDLRPHPPTLKSTVHFNVDKLNVFKHKNSNGEIMSGEEYFNTLWGKDIPAWSLHRLKCLLSNKIPYGSGYLTVEITNNVNLMFITDTSEQRVFSFIHENLYESMIKCIKWLISNGYFNKEYLKQ